jgi:hypothetical protein
MAGIFRCSAGWRVQFFDDDGDYVAEETVIGFCATKREEGNLSVVSIYGVLRRGVHQRRRRTGGESSMLIKVNFRDVKSDLTSRRRLLKLTGYAPIPLIGKSPNLKEWQRKLDVPFDEIERWERQFPQATNTGVLTRNVPVFDADILNRDAADGVERLVRERFGARGIILVRTGLAPKWAIPFRTDTPFKKISVLLTAPDGSKGQKIEFLGDGQQAVCFGIHPDTHRPYSWHGDPIEDEPGLVPRDQLPLINEEEAQAIIDDATRLLVDKFGYERADKKANEKNDRERIDWAQKLGNIIRGADLHDSLRDLAASMSGSGMSPGAVKGILRAAMNNSAAPRDKRWQERYDDIDRLVDGAVERFQHSSTTTPLFDPWAQFVVPPFPLDVLPPVAREFVTSQSLVIGCDPSALAMAVLGALSGALDHQFEIKMMKHGDWCEQPRLWILLVGPPSSKKTPIFDTAARPLEEHQATLNRQYQAEMFAYFKAKKRGKDVEKPKPPPRSVVWDTTTEKLGEILSRSGKGVLVKRDEIAGWVGGMEKYSNSARGGAADRAFWLKAFDGGSYAYDRLQRGEIHIDNLSVTMIGGIQPKRLAELHGLTSDGLLQRFIPVLMQQAGFALDSASSDGEFRMLMRQLIRAQPKRLLMTDDALAAMTGLRQHLHELAQASDGLADGFQTFVGKLEGYAGRLALILHMAANPQGGASSRVEAATIKNVRHLVVDFILPHALEFYRRSESTTDGDRLQRLASFVLTTDGEVLTTRDLTRNVAHLRGLGVFDINKHVSPLVAMGWLIADEPGPLNRRWRVNPAVKAQFAERKEAEEKRKQRLAELMGSPRKAQ